MAIFGLHLEEPDASGSFFILKGIIMRPTEHDLNSLRNIIRLNHKKNEICNLVLGFDDHYFDSADTIQALIPFEKYYQRIVYRNSNEYFNWIDAKDKYGNDEEKEVHFYGHSMSPADGDIIRLLIEGENTKTKIYYRKDHEEDRASMIKNLAIILTPNGLIKRMGGRNPTIELISI